MVVADWVQVGLMIALVFATSVLAWFTKNLYRVTKQLNEIEKKRDHDERRRESLRRLQKKINLAEEIINIEPRGMPFAVIHGKPLPDEIIQFRELARVLDYDHDEVDRADVDRVLLAFDNVSQGGDYGVSIPDDLLVVYERIQGILKGKLFTWRRQIPKLQEIS